MTKSSPTSAKPMVNGLVAIPPTNVKISKGGLRLDKVDKANDNWPKHLRPKAKHKPALDNRITQVICARCGKNIVGKIIDHVRISCPKLGKNKKPPDAGLVADAGGPAAAPMAAAALPPAAPVPGAAVPSAALSESHI